MRPAYDDRRIGVILWPVPMPSPAELRLTAVAAADAGARVAADWRSRGDLLRVEEKGIGDYVTAADRAVEHAILAVLRELTAGIPVVAEESGGARGEGLRWFVDPLDGTTNYLRGFPIVGVSVGLMEDGMPVAGAVTGPFIRDASWSAARGQGAYDGEGRRLRVSRHGGRGIVATAFPFKAPGNVARYRPAFDAAVTTFEDIRRAGAASLDLAYSAAGTFDGFFELGLSTWDLAAGSLLVLEAGGVVTDWAGDPHAVYQSGDLLAGSAPWHERMLDIIRDSAAGSE
jgi:myo-inositol-1(or 4)-monophosphatase